jgi:hypothetical protein
LHVPVAIARLTAQLIISARIEQACTSDTPTPAPAPVYEGRALEMRLSLRVGFAWSAWSGRGAAERGKEVELAFDVLPNPDEWIVLGRKKGSWTATVSWRWRLSEARRRPGSQLTHPGR